MKMYAAVAVLGLWKGPQLYAGYFTWGNDSDRIKGDGKAPFVLRHGITRAGAWTTKTYICWTW